VRRLNEEKFIIKGSAGKLKGTIPVRGSKNACLKAMAAAVLTDKPITIKNVPLIEDVFRMRELLEFLGAEVKEIGQHSFLISAENIKKSCLDFEIAKSFRASVALTGPLLARLGTVSFPFPGGCVIGKRPIDMFLNGFEKMGAKVFTNGKGNNFTIKVKVLKGAEIFFRIVSVTGTETLMMAATLARGRTVLRNAAQEPEIANLADFLNSCGARIKGAGTSTIVINGVKKLGPGVFNTPPDRIETGSFLILGALSGDKLRVIHCNPFHILSLIEYLESMGVSLKKGKDWVEISRPKFLKPINIKTSEYPGFPTDLQAPFSVLLTQARGTSSLFETVYDGRLNYINDLVRMGANIILCDAHRAIFHGKTYLKGREVEAPDLRAGLTFILAALIAKGKSIIHNVYNIDRGYEKIEERLRDAGAAIKRII
jgi:UDP-N-acetylglucosamine 1-carboxyvinyltransferase